MWEIYIQTENGPVFLKSLRLYRFRPQTVIEPIFHKILQFLQNSHSHNTAVRSSFNSSLTCYMGIVKGFTPHQHVNWRKKMAVWQVIDDFSGGFHHQFEEPAQRP